MNNMYKSDSASHNPDVEYFPISSYYKVKSISEVNKKQDFSFPRLLEEPY